MQVIEMFSEGKTGAPDGGEDVIAVTPDFVAVFDGVTSRSRLRFDGLTAGRFAAKTAADALRAVDPEASGAAVVEHLTVTLKAALDRFAFDPELVEGPASAFVLYSRHHRQVWQLGSGLAAVGGAALATSEPPSDRVVAEVRDLFISELLASGHNPADIEAFDPSHLLVAPLLEQQWRLRNRPAASRWSYGAIDGRPVPAEHLRTFDVPAGAEVVLVSDGYLLPAATLALAEEQLQTVAADDPLLLSYRPGFMAFRAGLFDDRSYVRLVHP